MASSRICSIEGCGKQWVARGLCSSHYNKWRTFGDPSYPIRVKNKYNSDEERRAAKKLQEAAFGKTKTGRAFRMRSSYRVRDRRVGRDICDLTVDEVVELLDEPCFYCGTTLMPRGLDRIDNNIGHIRGNVLPACRTCNVVRGAMFTVQEMQIIGTAIKRVLDARSVHTDFRGVVISEPEN